MNQSIKNALIALAAFTLVAIAAGCSQGFASAEKGAAYLTQSASSPRPANGSVQSSNEGAVTIDVKLVSVVDNNMVFEVAMNTHSVDLDQYDLADMAALRDDAGQEYRPISWDSAPGGHHRQGTLIFPVPDSFNRGQAKYIEMIIREVAGIKERILRWEL